MYGKQLLNPTLALLLMTSLILSTAIATVPLMAIAQAPIKEITLEQREWGFNQDNGGVTLVVQQGQTVKIIVTNKGVVPHDFFLGEFGVKSGLLDPGQTETLEFLANEVGVFTYYCTVPGHRQLGMEGQFIVQAVEGAPPAPQAESPTPADVSEAEPGVGEPEFTLSNAIAEGYWYSRYNLGNLVMRSGLGIPYQPTPEEMQKWMALVAQNPDDKLFGGNPPKNPAFIRGVFAGGDPSWVNPSNGDPGDFANFRWDPATFDYRLTPSAQVWTIMKEVEWAKLFHFAPHFGTPTSDFGATQRFSGMILMGEANANAKLIFDELTNTDHLIVHEATYDPESVAVTINDASIRLFDQTQLLIAVSNLAMITGDRDLWPRHFDPELNAFYLQWADDIFQYISNNKDSLLSLKTAELAQTVDYLIWYAVVTKNTDLELRAFQLIQAGSEELQERQGPNGSFARSAEDPSSATVPAQAYAIRALVQSSRATGISSYLDSAAAGYEYLNGLWDAEAKVFKTGTTKYVYKISDVGSVIGALSALRLFGGSSVDTARVSEQNRDFFLAVENLSGLQLTAPPPPPPTNWEWIRAPVALDFKHPVVPFPPQVSGTYGNGVAPVYGSEVTYDVATKAWTVTDPRFDTAGAMFTSTNSFWQHAGEIDAFPVPLNLRSQLSGLTSQLGDVQAQNTELTRQLDSLNNQLGEIHLQTTDASELVASLQAKNQRLLQEIAAQTNQIGNLNSQLKSLEAKISAFEPSAPELNADVTLSTAAFIIAIVAIVAVGVVGIVFVRRARK